VGYGVGPEALTDMKSFAFIESNTTGSGYQFFQKSLARGYKPVLLTGNPEKWKGYPIGTRVAKCETCDLDAIGNVCRQISGLSAIWSSSDGFVASAAALAKVFGFCGPEPGAIQASRNKRHQRTVLQIYGVPQPRYSFLDSEEDAARLVANNDIEFPMVVKPSCGTGKVGVRLVTTPCELMDHVRRLASGVIVTGVETELGFLAEEYIHGDEFSVEVFNESAVAVVRKRNCPPTFLEIGHSCPAGLSPESDRRVRDCAVAAVSALGLKWGPAHVELKLSASGRLAVVEVNPRLAGGNIPSMVQTAHHLDLVGATLDACLGVTPDLEIKCLCSAAIAFWIPQTAGVLVGVDGVEDARRMTGVVDVLIYKSLGDACPLDGTFRQRLGQVLARGETPQEAEGNAIAGVSSLRASIKPVIASEPFRGS